MSTKTKRPVRRPVVKLLKGGKTAAELARLYNVSDQTIWNWKAKELAEGTPTAPTASTPKIRERINVSGRKNKQFDFKIDSDWVPSKSSVNPELRDAICDKALHLLNRGKPGDSFPVPASVLVQSGLSAKSKGSLANSVRHMLSTGMKKDQVGRISLHEVPNGNKEVVAVRVRRRPEAI